MLQKYASKLLACNIGMSSQEATSLALQRLMLKFQKSSSASQHGGDDSKRQMVSELMKM